MNPPKHRYRIDANSLRILYADFLCVQWLERMQIATIILFCNLVYDPSHDRSILPASGQNLKLC